MIVQKSVSELLDAIESELQVWVRIGAIVPDHAQGWSLMSIDVTATQPPPNFEPLLWTYQRALFYAGVIPGQTVGQWLRSHTITIGETTIPLPDMPDFQHSQLHRHSSGSLASNGRFLWPTQEWTIPFNISSNPSLNEPLIGDGDTPSFIRADLAFAAVLGTELQAGGAFDSRSSVFRQQVTTARIRGVHIFPTRIEVDIDGDSLPGCVVELAGNHPGPTQPITMHGEQTVEIPTPPALPKGPWIVIKQNGDWLDQRFLDPLYSRGQANDVDYWVEPSERLEVLISAGEGPTTEFKREVPPDKIGMMKSVAAFSNAAGGLILIGVAKDGSILGTGPDICSADGVDSLTKMICSWVDPLPDFQIEVVEIGENAVPVVAVFVSKGSLPPYGAGTTDESIKYFVRRGATSFPASPDQVRSLARSTPPIEAPDFITSFK